MYDATARLFKTARANFESDYELKHVIGKGTNVVKRASEKTGRGDFAVKIFDKSSRTANPKAIINEIEILQKLRGAPQVVMMRDVYEDKDTVYLIIDLYAHDLLEAISKAQFFQESAARPIITSLVKAIDHLHRNSIIHMDIRPEKVLCGTDFTKKKGSVYLSDFGNAKVLEEGQKITKSSGAVSYLAPEIIRGSFFSFPADMWAFGVTCYVILGGYKPFDVVNATDSSLNQQITSGKVTFHAEEWKHVGDEGRDLILRLLELDEGKRATPSDVLNHPFILGTKLPPQSVLNNDKEKEKQKESDAEAERRKKEAEDKSKAEALKKEESLRLEREEQERKEKESCV